MFIKVYDRGHTWTRGAFLFVTQPTVDLPDDPKSFQNCRAFMRQVRLSQCGQFMMGHARIADRPAIEVNNLALRLSMSGTYGSDGLPKTVPRWIWQHGVQIPKEIADLWAVAGGHNDSGHEGQLFREWAAANQRKLFKAGRDLKPPRFIVRDIQAKVHEDEAGLFQCIPHFTDVLDTLHGNDPIIRITFDDKGYGHYVWNHGHELMVNIVASRPGTQTAGQLCDLLNCQDQPPSIP